MAFFSVRVCARSTLSVKCARSAVYSRTRWLSINGFQTVQIHQRLHSTKAQESNRFTLTEAQKTQFENEGYIMVKDVFDKEHIQRMKNALDECEEKTTSMTESTNHFTLDPHHTPENPMLQRVHIPSLLFPVFEETIRHERLLDIVEQLIGPNIRYIKQDKVNLKLPKGTGFPIKWHQDWAFNPHTNQKIVMACVSIDDTTKENGCLQVVPKSHKGPLLSHFKDGEFVSAINDSRFDPTTAVRLEVPSGGVSLHHVQAVHGSAANFSQDKRRLYVYQYCSTDAWPLLGVSSLEWGNTGPLDWERFTSTLVRGEITFFPKMESIPICLPVPFDKGYVFEHTDSIISSHENPM